MRLLSLAVRDFRGIAARRVELLETGVTILEGPNEVGKTSLAEAVELLFERLDSSTHVDVREAQPVGRDVGPEVEVEAVAGGVRFRYRKRFLKRPETVLEVLEPVAESLTGREAHERVDALLAAAGVDRGLWRALRVVQGQGAAQPETLAVSPSLLDALGTASAAVEEAAAGGGRHPVDLHQAVVAEHERYFTEKRREPTGELRRAREELAAAEAEAAALAAEMAAREADAERAGELERRQVELRGAVAVAREEERRAAAEVEGVAGLESRVAALRAALADEEATRELLEELEAARQAVEEVADRLRAARTAAAHAEQALAPAAAAAERASSALAASSAEVDGARQRARLAERLAARREALAEVEARVRRVEAAEARLRGAGERLAALPAVEDAALAALDRLEGEALRLEAGLEAASPRLQVTALADLRFAVRGGEGSVAGPRPAAGSGRIGESESGGGRGAGGAGGGGAAGQGGDGGAEAVELAPGESWQRRAAAPLRLELPGVAEIAVAPGGDAEALRRRREEVRDEHGRWLRELGVETVEAARAAHRERRSAEAERRAAQDVLADLAVGGEDPAAAALARRRTALADEVATLEHDLSAPPPPPTPHPAASGEADRPGDESSSDPEAASEQNAPPTSPEPAPGQDAPPTNGEPAPGRERSPTIPEPVEGRGPLAPPPSAFDPAAAEAALAAAEAALAEARQADAEARRRHDERRRALDTARGTVRELAIELRNAEERRRRAGERAGNLLRRRGDDGGALLPEAAATQPELDASPAEPPPPTRDDAVYPPTSPRAAAAAADPGQLALFAAAAAAATSERAGAPSAAGVRAGGGDEAAGTDAAGSAGPAPGAPAGAPAGADLLADLLADPLADPFAVALAEAERRVTAAGDALAAARRRLAEARPQEVRRRAAAAAERRGAEERRQREAEDEHLAVRTRLESAGDHDLFERLGEARGRVAAAGRAAASVEARAAAAARLLAAVDAARAAARRTYSEPLARTVEELGRPLFGDGFAVELDERLNVVRRTAGGVTLEVSRLSTGAQEQLALLLRLACAVLVSPAEGVPLVVDDALGHSDKARLRAMGEVLSRVGERCQVLVLTCFPERYAAVAGARRLRLEGPPGAAGGDEPETMEECDE